MKKYRIEANEIASGAVVHFFVEAPNVLEAVKTLDRDLYHFRRIDEV